MNVYCENLKKLKDKISNENIKIVAVSKSHPVASIIELYKCGHRVFGENRALELNEKYEILKDHDMEWHMIGHLQRNKVKYIAPYVSLIHSVDSFRLLQEINKQAEKNDRIIDCLLQFHIATESTKFGFSIEECKEILKSDEFKKLQNVNICGVMGMATFTEDLEIVRKEFRTLKNIFNSLKVEFFEDNARFKEISMGMTSDWEIGIEESATILRIGTLIFGER